MNFSENNTVTSNLTVISDAAFLPFVSIILFAVTILTSNKFSLCTVSSFSAQLASAIKCLIFEQQVNLNNHDDFKVRCL